MAEEEPLESRIGSHWLNRVGILAVLIGVSSFLRYALENGWIGAWGSVAMGLAAGAAVLLWSERFRVRGYLAFSWSLKGIGIGTLYLTVWAAFQVYGLVPLEAAFAGMTAITALTTALALRQEAPILAVFATFGGYATPPLLGATAGDPLALFLYATLLNAATLGMIRSRPWTPLLAVAFTGTTLLYILWHLEAYAAGDRGVALTFATIFFAMFAAAPLVARRPADDPQGRAAGAWPFWTASARPVLLLVPAANAAVFLLQIVAILGPLHDRIAPGAAVILAAVYFTLARLAARGSPVPSHRRTLSLVHTGIGLALVTIAIPLEFDGPDVTLAWMAQAAALLWIAERADSAVAVRFGIGALALAISKLLLLDDFAPGPLLLNGRFMTFACGIAILAVVAGAGRRRGASEPTLALTTIALNVLALVALSREVEDYFTPAPAQEFYPRGAVAAARDFAYSAVWMGYGAVVMLAGFLLRWAALRWQALAIVAVAIVKVFTYDVANLEQVYRIVSFIALGLLLLTISFAYQRDWLRLREGSDRSGGVSPR